MGPRTLFADPAAYDAWEAQWQQRLGEEDLHPAARAQAMRSCNPARIPRNHRVEQAIRAAVDFDDLEPAITLLKAVSVPYAEDESLAQFTLPAQAAERVTQTFCGT